MTSPAHTVNLETPTVRLDGLRRMESRRTFQPTSRKRFTSATRLMYTLSCISTRAIAGMALCLSSVCLSLCASVSLHGYLFTSEAVTHWTENASPRATTNIIRCGFSVILAPFYMRRQLVTHLLHFCAPVYNATTVRACVRFAFITVRAY